MNEGNRKPKQLAFKLIHLTYNISMFGRSASRLLTAASRRTSLASPARLQAISSPRAGPSTSFARFITSDKGDSLVHPTQQPSTSPDRLADAIQSVAPPASTFELFEMVYFCGEVTGADKRQCSN